MSRIMLWKGEYEVDYVVNSLQLVPVSNIHTDINGTKIFNINEVNPDLLSLPVVLLSIHKIIFLVKEELNLKLLTIRLRESGLTSY